MPSALCLTDFASSEAACSYSQMWSLMSSWHVVTDYYYVASRAITIFIYCGILLLEIAHKKTFRRYRNIFYLKICLKIVIRHLKVAFSVPSSIVLNVRNSFKWREYTNVTRVLMNSALETKSFLMKTLKRQVLTWELLVARQQPLSRQLLRRLR